jgi:hypothetical protein
MDQELLSVPDAHPYAAAVALANAEFRLGQQAAAAGNEGRARVCGRRAVGTFVQTIALQGGADYGSHAMANLRGIQEDASLPDDVRAAAERLLGGNRHIVHDEPYSSDPLGDALLIINYFLGSAS